MNAAKGNNHTVATIKNILGIRNVDALQQWPLTLDA
jgi:hypothetical protein